MTSAVPSGSENFRTIPFEVLDRRRIFEAVKKAQIGDGLSKFKTLVLYPIIMKAPTFG